MMELPEHQSDRKVVSIGSSSGVTIPPELQDQLGITEGSEIKLVKLQDENHARIIPAGADDGDESGE